jgi:hypothetical protein
MDGQDGWVARWRTSGRREKTDERARGPGAPPPSCWQSAPVASVASCKLALALGQPRDQNSTAVPCPRSARRCRHNDRQSASVHCGRRVGVGQLRGGRDAARHRLQGAGMRAAPPQRHGTATDSRRSAAHPQLQRLTIPAPRAGPAGRLPRSLLRGGGAAPALQGARARR